MFKVSKVLILVLRVILKLLKLINKSRMYKNGVKRRLHKRAVLYQSKCMYFDAGIKVIVAHGLKSDFLQ